jgi:hypothetical protein
MPLDEVFAYLRACDRRSFQVVACNDKAPGEADVAAFEAEVGFDMPPELREFTLSPFGGLYLAVREELWPRPKLYDIGPFWSFQYGLCIFGIAEDIPDWLDIREQYRRHKAEGHPDLVPFFKLVGSGDKYCFDSSGRVIRWAHEVPQSREEEKVTFSELLMREVRDLEARKERKARGES